MTNRDVEKKAQEEAEAKLQAEELQRLEEERKCREEEDSRNRELDARNRAVELSRLNAEEETFRDYNQTKLRKLDAMLKLKKEEKDVSAVSIATALFTASCRCSGSDILRAILDRRPTRKTI